MTAALRALDLVAQRPHLPRFLTTVAQSTVWVMVAWYVPAVTLRGMVTIRVGFQLVVLTAVPEVLLKAVRGPMRCWACAAVSWPGTRVPAPVVAVAGPDQ
ncbi:hypothetical protein AWV63_02695 [Micromonospora rifamycinica]|nr:hypothetical protein AWV63_02695 [Micromonospora rifamycinica]